MGEECFSADMISHLPSSIIDNILQRLPLHDVVRTSILSREWRYKWVTIPKLEFDEHFEQKCLKTNKLENVIYQVLLVHRGPILEFTLSAHDFKSSPGNINRWIRFLSKHNVQKLTLRIWWGSFCSMSSYIFSLVHLSHLCLCKCLFKPPVAFKGFTKLVEVSLQAVVLEPETFGSFISKCPLLERLSLSGCSSFGPLAIDGPKLKFFSFAGSFSSIWFKNTSLLNEVLVSLLHPDLTVSQNEGTNSNLIKFFSPLLLIEKLLLDFQILEYLAVGVIPKKLPCDLSHLKTADFSFCCLDKIEEVSCVLCLIRSSPNLQNLKLTAMTSDGVDLEPSVELLRSQKKLDLPLNHLRKVKVRRFYGFEPEMEFVKLVLASATVLEKMDIRSLHESASLEGSRMLKVLARFPRASAKAEIIFED